MIKTTTNGQRMRLGKTTPRFYHKPGAFAAGFKNAQASAALHS
jgi:hypothetical protein